ncbi:hypothetical protein FOBRF1_006718 [Fusarium oxysporum]
MSEPIPTPKGYPFIDIVLDVNLDHLQESLTQFAESYAAGPIFKLHLPAARIFVANYALAKDVLDEIRFEKAVRPSLLRQDVMTARVPETRLLAKPGAPRKRHIGILNHPDVVHRVMRRFPLPWDAPVSIDGSKSTSLPTGQSLSAQNLLAGMLELGQPATERQVQQLAETIPDKTKSDELKERVTQDDFHKSNTTLLDLLEDYPSATISSSPVSSPSPSECSLIYSVIDAPARGSSQGHRYLGVASTYLERLQPGDHIQVGVRPSRSGFHLPIDTKTPIVMACAGTGLAPFYGFVAERAVKKSQGPDVGPAVLFYGCNNPDEDDLYHQQFDEWERGGVVKVYRPYTLAWGKSENCKFVQDRMWFSREDIVRLFCQGAQVFMSMAGLFDHLRFCLCSVAAGHLRTLYKSTSEHEVECRYRIDAIREMAAQLNAILASPQQDHKETSQALLASTILMAWYSDTRYLLSVPYNELKGNY